MNGDEERLQIGEFAELVGLSIPQLRRYDSLRLLEPAGRSVESGYRLYTRGQTGAARVIALLRSMDMPIAEIRRIVSGTTESERRSIFRNHRGVHIHVDLTDVADGELLEGVMHVSGRLQEDIEPFETRLRVEFYDEADGRTRLEIRQWLPEHLAHPSEEGWRQAFTKLDATLMNVQAVEANHREVEAWQS